MTDFSDQLILPLETLERCDDAFRVCRSLLGPVHKAMVMGSGWATKLESCIPGMIRLPFSELGWGETHVIGHQNALFYLDQLKTLILGGRFHMYAGKTPEDVVLPILLAYRLGAREIVLTNAAGAVNPGFHIGQIVLISDHLNCTRRKIHSKAWGFRPLYSAECRKKMSRMLADSGLTCSEGIYAGVLGPAYETPGEASTYQSAGADMIGMSTVLEAETASALGMDVLGLSLITNRIPISYNQINSLSHEEVIGVAFHHLEDVFSVIIRYLTD